MKRLLLALLCLVVVSSWAHTATAQVDPITVLDSGRLIVTSGRRVVATEEFEFVQQVDSITVNAWMSPAPAAGSAPAPEVRKRMTLVVSAADFGLRSYLSNDRLDNRIVVKGVIPGDTAMTIYVERDGAGSADKLPQPPGRLFVMDPGLFTLFDVICHSFAGKTITKRPVQLVALAESAETVEATVTLLGPDTLAWGGRRTPVRKLEFADPSSAFTVWIDASSHMLRLEHAQSGLVVTREAPAAPKKPARTGKKKPATTR